MNNADKVIWGSISIPYSYQFSNRRTISLHVYPDLSVVVKAPFGASPEQLRAFVKKRGRWIRKAWREFDLYLPKLPPRRYVSGETHRYLGRQYRLKIAQGKDDTVKCYRGFFFITTRARPDAEATRALLTRWYRLHAVIVFNERLLVCHNKVIRFGIPLPPLQVRKMKTRWGSLSHTGGLTLNIELVKVPKECIDYVILHELCHFKEKHHGLRFWSLLQRLMPDYEELRAQLNLSSE